MPVFTTVIKSVIGNRGVCLFYTDSGNLHYISVMIHIRRYSCNFIISVFLFVASGDYLQWTYNGIRQFIPVAILFACAGLILKKEICAIDYPDI